ncbi:MAG: OPT/YSL family transporter, partial [Pseudomonadota bacterium]
GLVGILLPLLSLGLPKRFRFLVPSPMGLGMAFTFHFFYSFSMFLGALIARILEQTRPQVAEAFTIPVASGLIAGESLAAIGVALYLALSGG